MFSFVAMYLFPDVRIGLSDLSAKEHDNATLDATVQNSADESSNGRDNERDNGRLRGWCLALSLTLHDGSDQCQDELDPALERCRIGMERHVKKDDLLGSLLPPEVSEAREVDEVTQIVTRIFGNPKI